MGSEKLISFIYHPWRERYEEYRKEDICYLCKKHHRKYHKLIRTQTLVGAFWKLVAEQNGKITRRQAELWRHRFRRNTLRWLGRPSGLLASVGYTSKDKIIPGTNVKLQRGSGVGNRGAK